MNNEKEMNNEEAKSWRVSSDRFLPLELTKTHHICLWSEDATYKWTIGYFDFEKEGPRFKFVGDRPLDIRVNWDNFKLLIELGYALADHHHAAKNLNEHN